MICKPCAIGADVNQYFRDNGLMNDSAEHTVTILHARCAGKTHCNCQHFRGRNHLAPVEENNAGSASEGETPTAIAG